MERTVDFDSAFARILSALRIRTQVELADVIGIRQSSISDAKRRGAIPDGWLVTLAISHGLHPQWILTGQGGMYCIASDSPATTLLGAEVARIRAEAKEEAKQELLTATGLEVLLDLLRRALPAGTEVTFGGSVRGDATNVTGSTTQRLHTN